MDQIDDSLVCLRALGAFIRQGRSVHFVDSVDPFLLLLVRQTFIFQPLLHGF